MHTSFHLRSIAHTPNQSFTVGKKIAIHQLIAVIALHHFRSLHFSQFIAPASACNSSTQASVVSCNDYKLITPKRSIYSYYQHATLASNLISSFVAHFPIRKIKNLKFFLFCTDMYGCNVHVCVYMLHAYTFGMYRYAKWITSFRIQIRFVVEELVFFFSLSLYNIIHFARIYTRIEDFFFGCS